MGSDAKKPPKPRFRFNFLGPDEKRRTAESTRDDILNSLKSSQAHVETMEERGGQGMEGLDSSRLQGPNSLSHGLAGTQRNRHAGRSALLIFIGGFLAIWGYGYLTGAYHIPYMSLILQNQAVELGANAVSTNPVEAGLVFGGALLATLFALHRRKSSS